MNRAFANVLCKNVEVSAVFYERLLGMTRHGDFGWFVILTHPDMPRFEFGLLDIDHDSVPDDARRPAGGALLTFVVDDLDAVERRAAELGARVVAPPTDMPYGQRRMVLRDPDGTCLDISCPVPT